MPDNSPRSTPRDTSGKRRIIESHLPARWRARRVRKRARLAAMSRRRRIWRRVGVIATWFLGLLAVFMVVSVTLFYTLSDVPSPDTIQLQQNALIEYSDGSVLASYGSVDRSIVPLSEVSDSVKWAVLAAEDRQFYSEPGVSIKGTIRAALSDLTGGDTQGGSGITQQYVKNAYLNSSRTLTRKLKELAISLKLARSYSKDQILEWYLNTVYFGRNAWGIQAAAEEYFHTPASKLDVAQAAMLAGMLQSPNYYDPTNNLAASKDRWQYVLKGMVATGHLSAEQEATEKFPAYTPNTNQTVTSGPDGLIERQVLDELSADGITADQVATGGLRIQTTIDKSAQADAVNAIATAYANPTAQQANLQKALVAVNPADGSVVAYYGGAVGTNLDYASQAWRQPGSTFKPYVLATALQQNLAGKTPAYTIRSEFNGASPQTIDGQVINNDPTDPRSGTYSLTQAMTLSLNTVFYQLASDVGAPNVATTAHAVGIPKTNDGTPTLQTNGVTDDRIGIGGYEVRPIDQAVGYATLADGGTTHQAFFVQKVTNSSGVVLYQHKTTGTPALNPKVANDTTLSMEQVAGSSGLALDGNRAVAAKTGTVGIADSANSSDAWTVGFTSQISVASWAGSNGTGPIYNNSGTSMYGRQNPGQAWQLFMNSYLKSKPVVAMPTKQQVGVAPVAATSSAASSPSTSPTPTPTPTPTTSSSSPKPTPTRTPTPTPTTPKPTPTTSTPPPSTSESSTPLSVTTSNGPAPGAAGGPAQGGVG